MQLFRSDYSKQRILSSRILTGILRYRELIVSLPSYSCEFTISENSRDICIDPLKMEELRIDSSYRAVIRLFKTLCMEYEAICATYANRLRNSRDNELLSFQETRDFVCRVCSRALCASVLPPTLPSLLLLDLKRATSGSASALQQQHLLQCLRFKFVCLFSLVLKCIDDRCGDRSFLSSPVEEAHASLLWLGLWGQYGCPVLPMPHTIRPLALSYEQHIRQCKMKKCSFLHMEDEPVGGLDEAEQPTLSNSSPDPSDVFALQCRWGRIDAMFQACEEFDIFYSVILVPILNSLSCVSRAVQGSSNNSSSSTGDRFTSGDEELAILNGIAALEISVLVVKGGDSDLVRLFSQRILRKIAAPYSNFLKTLMTRDKDSTAGLELDRKKVIVPMYLAAWCRLLAEWARRCDRDVENGSKLSQDILENESLWSYIASRVSAYFNRVGSITEESDLSGSTEHIAQQSQEVVWMLRLWRVCLGRGNHKAMSQAALLLGGQNPVAASIINSTIIKSMRSDMWGHVLIARAEFFWLLEQLIVSVSIQLNSISTLLSPFDAELGSSEMLYQLILLMVDLAMKVIQQEFQLSVPSHSSPSLNLLTASVYHFLGSILQIQKKSISMESLDHPSVTSSIKMLVDGVRANVTVRGGFTIHIRHSSGSGSGGGYSELDDGKWSELEAVLAACRESMIAQLMQVSSTSQNSHGAENLKTSSWASEEMLTAAMRLLSILTVDTELEVNNVDACILQASTVAGHSPCVSQGLLLWQRHRLNQARVLIRLRYLSSMIDRSIQAYGSTGITSMHYIKTLKTTLEDYLFTFTDGLLGYILFLYLDLIRVQANLTYPDQVNWSEFKSYLIGIVLKIKIVEAITTIHTDKQPLHQFERFLLQDLTLLSGSRAATLSQYYPSSLLDCPHTTTRATESIHYSYDEEKGVLQPLLQRSFLFRMLTDQGLSGQNLLLVLQLLLNIQKAEREQSIHMTAQAIADKVFYLMSLTLIEHTNRWNAIIPPESNKRFEEYPAVIPELPIVFVQLFESVLHQAQLFCQSLDWSERYALRNAFYIICAKEYFSMRKFLNVEKTKKNDSKKSGTADTSGGSSGSSSSTTSRIIRAVVPNDSHAYEFCCQVISSGLNQSISSEVHSIVMAAIGLIPANALFPPRARDRLWADIGQLRLVHLLEEHVQCSNQVVQFSYLQSWFPVNNLKSDQERDVEDSNLDALAMSPMVRALATWRAQQADASIVNIMCFQITSAIFSLRGDSTGQLHWNTLITGDRAKLIHSLMDRQSCPLWILERVVSMLLLLLLLQSKPMGDDSLIRSNEVESLLVSIFSDNTINLSKPMSLLLGEIRDDPAALGLLDSIQVAASSKSTGKQKYLADTATCTSFLTLLEAIITDL